MNDTLSDNYRGVWGQRIGFGRRPALLAIDFMQAYTTEGAPLFAPGVVSAVEESRELLACARRTGIPVIHTHIRYHAGRRSCAKPEAAQCVPGSARSRAT